MTERTRAGRVGDALALALTELLAPVVVVGLTIAGAIAIAAPSPAVALRWAGIGVGGAVLVPQLALLAGVHLGRLQGRHLPDRRQRALPFLAWAAALVLAATLLRRDGAPPAVDASLLGLAATLVGAAAANLVWQLSLHTALAAATVATAVLFLGPPGLIAVPAVPLIAWARLRLGAHTPAQVAAGTILGTAAALCYHFVST